MTGTASFDAHFPALAREVLAMPRLPRRPRYYVGEHDASVAVGPRFYVADENREGYPARESDGPWATHAEAATECDEMNKEDRS